MDGNDALNRLKGMVVEVPGTEWTVADAAKLSGLEPTVCRAILETLERDGLLTRRADGVFVRGLTRARSPVLGGDQMDPVTPVEPGELLLQRIRREYRELPALRLSLRQAQRLWGVDAATRDAAIRRLLDERFLCCTPGGTYAREKRRWPRPAPIKATLASGRSPRRQGRQQ